MLKNHLTNGWIERLKAPLLSRTVGPKGNHMKFSYYDLENRSGGEVVEVTLSGNAANVFLVDS